MIRGMGISFSHREKKDTGDFCKECGELIFPDDHGYCPSCGKFAGIDEKWWGK